ncbi:MAG: phosphotransferase family protein [Acidimicrobiia bacterium]
MPLAVARELDDVVAGITRWLHDARGASGVDVLTCERPSDGLSSETVLVRAALTVGGVSRDQSFVFRLPPLGEGIFPSYRLDVQAAVQDHVRAHGVPAAPVECVADEQYFGVPFLVMPKVDGHVPASTPQTDPWITDLSGAAQDALYGCFLDAIAAVHAVPTDALAEVVPTRDLDAELAYWRAYLDWYADGHRIVPTLHDALEWCTRTRPADPPNALLWGDVRMGNLIFDEQRHVAAVLDWEMVSIGAPEHDLGWCWALESMQDEMLRCRVDGFPTRNAAQAAFEARIGRPLQAMPWFEIFALVRSTSIMTRIAVLHERAGVPNFFPIADNPILDVITARIARHDQESA